MRILVCIYPAPPPQAGCNKRLISKQRTTSVNSEFSFSYWLPYQS